MTRPLDPEGLRLAVYRGFAADGRPPGTDALAEQFRVDRATVTEGLRDLAHARHLVMDEQDRILMAHPFASIPLGFAVMGRRTLWWGGCAWDSFALPHLLPDEPDVLVSTRCPGCGRPLAWVVNRDAEPAGPQVAHFLLPVSRMWDDVVQTCGNQRLFCDRGCVAGWLTRTAQQPGYVMNLATLWRLARGWYSGRLDRGYLRRDPGQAREYFREAGLQGAFWGL